MEFLYIYLAEKLIENYNFEKCEILMYKTLLFNNATFQYIVYF